MDFLLKSMDFLPNGKSGGSFQNPFNSKGPHYLRMGSPWIRQGSLLISLGNPLVWNANPLISEGNPLKSEGNLLRFNGNPLKFDGNPLKFNGNPLKLDGNPFKFNGNPLKSDGNPLDYLPNGKFWKLSQSFPRSQIYFLFPGRLQKSRKNEKMKNKIKTVIWKLTFFIFIPF